MLRERVRRGERGEAHRPIDPRCPRCGQSLRGLDPDLWLDAGLTLCFPELVRRAISAEPSRAA